MIEGAVIGLVIGLALLQPGESQSGESPAGKPQAERPSAREPDTVAQGHGPSQQPGLVDQAGLQALIAKGKGSVVVLNLWATWCVPCVQELPDLIRLSKDADVKVIGLSIDEPDDLTTKVVPFLRKHAVPYPMYIKAAGKDEQFINGLNQRWSGAVPATFIYDAAGRQRLMLIGKQTYASLRKAIDPFIVR